MSGRSTPGGGRAEILLAAIHEFAKFGYVGATTAGIARFAGVTQPLVHHHFGSKAGLWKEVLTYAFETLFRELGAAVSAAEGQPRQARIATLLRAVTRFAGRQPELVRILSLAKIEKSDAVLHNMVRGGLGIVGSLLKSEVATAEKEGVIVPIEPAFAYALVLGAAVFPYLDPSLIQEMFGVDMLEPTVVERYADMVMNIYLRGALTRTENA